MEWNYLSIPKLQRLHRWSLGMDKLFHPTLHNGCDYISMLGLKLTHVSKRGYWRLLKYRIYLRNPKVLKSRGISFVNSYLPTNSWNFARGKVILKLSKRIYHSKGCYGLYMNFRYLGLRRVWDAHFSFQEPRDIDAIWFVLQVRV